MGRTVGGVVLSDESNDESGPEAEDDADVAFPSAGSVDLASEDDLSAVNGEHVDSGDDHDGHEDGGDTQLNLQDSLDVLDLNVGEELADEGGI